MSDKKFCKIMLHHAEWQLMYNELANVRKIDFQKVGTRGDDFSGNDGLKLVTMDDLIA